MTIEELIKHARAICEDEDDASMVVEFLPSDLATGDLVTPEMLGRRLTKQEVVHAQVEAMRWPDLLQEKP